MFLRAPIRMIVQDRFQADLNQWQNTEGFPMRRLSLLVGSTLFAATALQAVTSDAGCHCGCCRRADPCRGSAIRSPLESPDCCDCPVGGKYVCRPYYPGYMWDRCVPPSYTTTGYSITGPG